MAYWAERLLETFAEAKPVLAKFIAERSDNILATLARASQQRSEEPSVALAAQFGPLAPCPSCISRRLEQPSSASSRRCSESCRNGAVPADAPTTPALASISDVEGLAAHEFLYEFLSEGVRPPPQTPVTRWSVSALLEVLCAVRGLYEILGPSGPSLVLCVREAHAALIKRDTASTTTEAQYYCGSACLFSLLGALVQCDVEADPWGFSAAVAVRARPRQRRPPSADVETKDDFVQIRTEIRRMYEAIVAEEREEQELFLGCLDLEEVAQEEMDEDETLTRELELIQLLRQLQPIAKEELKSADGLVVAAEGVAVSAATGAGEEPVRRIKKKSGGGMSPRGSEDEDESEGFAPVDEISDTVSIRSVAATVNHHPHPHRRRHGQPNGGMLRPPVTPTDAATAAELMRSKQNDDAGMANGEYCSKKYLCTVGFDRHRHRPAERRFFAYRQSSAAQKLWKSAKILECPFLTKPDGCPGGVTHCLFAHSRVDAYCMECKCWGHVMSHHADHNTALLSMLTEKFADYRPSTASAEEEKELPLCPQQFRCLKGLECPEGHTSEHRAFFRVYKEPVDNSTKTVACCRAADCYDGDVGCPYAHSVDDSYCVYCDAWGHLALSHET